MTEEKHILTMLVDNDELEKLLMTDEKTGLFNFREFQRRLREEWQRGL